MSDRAHRRRFVELPQRALDGSLARSKGARQR
jgi:hypothetical protein